MENSCQQTDWCKAFGTLALIPVRLILGTLFIAHGGQKLFGLFGGHGFAATAGMFAKMGFIPGDFWAGLAGGTEFFGGLAVVIGLLTRVGALGIAIVMGVAIFKVHWTNGLIGEGSIEYPLALFGMALALIFGGAGPWLNIDSVIFKKK